MCGISGIVRSSPASGFYDLKASLAAMICAQRHRGPDDEDAYFDPRGQAALGHNRLSILDLSAAGKQPMTSDDGRLHLVFNGEIYNYLELRRELSDVTFRTGTDSEVLLAAYARWGRGCLDRLIGMFAFAIWDEGARALFAARDRFGVKPLYYAKGDENELLFASEIKALHAAGVAAVADEATWATFLATGVYDHTARTFWRGIEALPAGHWLEWKQNRLRIGRWYDVAERVGDEIDVRLVETVEAEYESLLRESVAFRFRADVPVGINLSGGLDSSALLAIVHAVQGSESNVSTFTYVTGDERYDEWPWVEKMLAQTLHPAHVCRLSPQDVPALAESISYYEDEPFGGLPTIAYARVFEQARAAGVLVLLDGQGMDEQWAGYDYYAAAVRGGVRSSQAVGTVQGTRESPTRAGCLAPEFRARAEAFAPEQPFAEPLRNLQYRDIRYSKIPRALRFNDRISMRVATELREPFLDHRLVELALRQGAERKIQGSTQKWLLRRLTARLAPRDLAEAPKRPLQTPQREWLRGPLREWARDCLETALASYGGVWLQSDLVREQWRAFEAGVSDNSFYIWQWISLAMAQRRASLSAV